MNTGWAVAVLLAVIALVLLEHNTEATRACYEHASALAAQGDAEHLPTLPTC